MLKEAPSSYRDHRMSLPAPNDDRRLCSCWFAEESSEGGALTYIMNCCYESLPASAVVSVDCRRLLPAGVQFRWVRGHIKVLMTTGRFQIL